jgi:hypothetical protein
VSELRYYCRSAWLAAVVPTIMAVIVPWMTWRTRGVELAFAALMVVLSVWARRTTDL